MTFKRLISDLGKQLAADRRRLVITKRYDQQFLVKGRIEATERAIRLAQRLQREKLAVS